MAFKLQHVVTRGPALTETPSAFFQVQQGRFDLDALTHLLDSHEQMLLIEATMLPARPVETRQHAGHLLQQLLVDRDAETLTTAPSIPVIELLKAFKRLGHQQTTPESGSIALHVAIAQARRLDPE